MLFVYSIILITTVFNTGINAASCNDTDRPMVNCHDLYLVCLGSNDTCDNPPLGHNCLTAISCRAQGRTWFSASKERSETPKVLGHPETCNTTCYCITFYGRCLYEIGCLGGNIEKNLTEECKKNKCDILWSNPH